MKKRILLAIETKRGVCVATARTSRVAIKRANEQRRKGVKVTIVPYWRE